MHCIFQRYTVSFFFFHDEKTTIRNKFAWNWRYCFINPRAQLRHEWFEIVQGTKGCLCLEHERALSRKQARQKAGKNQHFHFFQRQASIDAMIHRHPIKKWRDRLSVSTSREQLPIKYTFYHTFYTSLAFLHIHHSKQSRLYSKVKLLKNQSLWPTHPPVPHGLTLSHSRTVQGCRDPLIMYI